VPPAPAKNLHEDLVAPGRKRGAGNDLAPHGKEPPKGSVTSGKSTRSNAVAPSEMTLR